MSVLSSTPQEKRTKLNSHWSLSHLIQRSTSLKPHHIPETSQVPALALQLPRALTKGKTNTSWKITPWKSTQISHDLEHFRRMHPRYAKFLGYHLFQLATWRLAAATTLQRCHQLNVSPTAETQLVPRIDESFPWPTNNTGTRVRTKSRPTRGAYAPHGITGGPHFDTWPCLTWAFEPCGVNEKTLTGWV